MDIQRQKQNLTIKGTNSKTKTFKEIFPSKTNLTINPKLPSKKNKA
jgi:hypothetical protein